MLNRLCQALTIVFACTFSLFLGLAQAQNSGTFPASGGGGGTPGGANTQVQFNNSSAFGGSANLTWVSPNLTVGVQQTTQGGLVLGNTAAGAFATTVKSSNSATAAWTMTLPTSAGANTNVLQTDGSGNTSWVAAGGGGGCTSNCTITETAGNTALTLTGATQTTAGHPVLNMTQTWNNAATDFTGLQHNITRTASGAGSKLIDFQLGGTSYLSANGDGSISVNQVGSALTTSSFNVNFQGSQVFNVNYQGVVTAIGSSAAYTLPVDGLINWSGNGQLYSQGSGNISQAHLAVAQAFYAYNTTDSNTSPTNYERGGLDWKTTANTLTVGAQKGGTGTLRNTALVGALITIPGITTDATHTDSTVCQDTTTHALYFGSGTLGICLGTSSARFKTLIKPADEGLAKVTALKPVRFFYKDGYGDNGAKEQRGFVAEDVVNVMPNLVGLDAEGKPNSVDLVGMIPALVRSVQELKADNDNLRAEIKWLKTAKQARATNRLP